MAGKNSGHHEVISSPLCALAIAHRFSQLNRLSRDEKVEGDTEVVGQCHELISLPAAATIHLGIESRMGDAELLGSSSACEAIDEQQMVHSLGDEFVAAERA